MGIQRIESAGSVYSSESGNTTTTAVFGDSMELLQGNDKVKITLHYYLYIVYA